MKDDDEGVRSATGEGVVSRHQATSLSGAIGRAAMEGGRPSDRAAEGGARGGAEGTAILPGATPVARTRAPCTDGVQKDGLAHASPEMLSSPQSPAPELSLTGAPVMQPPETVAPMMEGPAAKLPVVVAPASAAPAASPASLTELFERGALLAADCPSREVLKHLTSRWGVLVLIALRSETLRFGDLRRRIGGVSERMLSQTLQWLERDGMVDRRAYRVVPPHVEYSLTPLGREAAEKVSALADWIEVNLPRIAAHWAEARD